MFSTGNVVSTIVTVWWQVVTRVIIAIASYSIKILNHDDAHMKQIGYYCQLYFNYQKKNLEIIC